MSDSDENVKMTGLDTGLLNPANPGQGVRQVTQRPLEVDAESEVFNMSRNVRKAVIFNHNSFIHDNLEERTGTLPDVEALRTTLASFKFAVTVFEDFTKIELLQKLEELRTEDNSDCDCLAIFVLTHGKVNILAAKDKYYTPDELWTHFASEACPTMAGKPKLIFINACRGAAYDFGVEFVSDLTTDGAPNKNNTYQIVYNIPNNADFLVVFSTFDGYVSHRPDEGSWFIQDLCDALNNDKYRKMEIKQILTRVSKKVALRTSKKRMKQVPVIVSTLTRDLFLS